MILVGLTTHLHTITDAALGLDPRVTSNLALAVSGPRIKSEDSARGSNIIELNTTQRTAP
ncbi:hypothetical protein ABIE28_000862 [Devosia sp. 2618]